MICDNCALRLYNTKHHNLEGIGNPWTGKCIVVPNVDYDAYKCGDMNFSKQVDIITSVFNLSSTGGLLQTCYIVPLIRCNETISCKLDDASYQKCLKFFARDIVKFGFKDILLLGDAGRRFLNCDISSYFNTVFISPNKRRYTVNYSPLIKYIDSDKFEIFKKNLIKWYNATNSDLLYCNYDIKVL